MQKFLLLCFCMVLTLFATNAKAQQLMWDPQGTNGPNPYTGSLSGNWEAANWSTSQTGQASPQLWMETNAAEFAVHSGVGTPAVTITMNSNHTITGIAEGTLTPNSNPCQVTINGSGSFILPASAIAQFIVNTYTNDPGSITINVPITGMGQVAVHGVAGPGVGQVFFGGANTYSGTTTITNATLTLTGAGSINNSTNISIAPNGFFDVSATNFYALSTNTTLAASGFSDVVGAGAAVIKGGSGGTISLGSQPISLTFNGNSTEPELYISQGTLSLAGNAFTVNNSFGQLQAGSYFLIKQASGSIMSSGSNSVTVTGSGVTPGAMPTIQVSGNSLLLVIREPPSFSNLSGSQSITYGMTNVALSGKLSAAGPMFPAIGETVTVTINGNAQSTTITGNQGTFSINYNPSTIPVSGSAYPITYSYAGDASLTPAIDTNTTLTVFASTNTWISPVNGKWERATNWSLGAPGLTEFFDTITNVGSKTVSIDFVTVTAFTNTLTVTNLTIGAPNGSFNTLLLNNTGTNASLHVINNLTVLPRGAITLSNSFFAVDNASNTAELTLNGSTLTLVGSTFLADHLILTNGGSLITATNFVVGSTNGVTNTATITGGSTVTLPGVVFGIGNDGTTTNGSGTGVVIVTNGTLNASTINLGSSAGGSGTLTIQSNGVVNVTSNMTVVGNSPTSTSSVSVAGGSLTASNGLIQVGTTGTGLMTVSNGTVTAQSIKLGSSDPTASGTLTLYNNSHLRITGTLSVNSDSSFDLPGINVVVDGSGSTVIVGEDNNGAMRVTSPSVSMVWQSMFIGYSPGVTGTYIQSAGQVIVNNNLIVGSCVTNGPEAVGFVTLSGGTLYVTNSSHTATLVVGNGTVMLQSGATLVVDNLIITNACARFQNNAGTLTYGQLTLDPTLDADGDGVSNGAEILAGTDPLNPSSSFRTLGVTVSGQDVIVSWTSVPGHSYVVQASNTGIAGGSFTDVSPPVSASGPGNGTTNYRLAGGAAHRAGFYRVRLGP